MPEMDTEALQRLVAGWVVKMSPSTPPQRLGENERTRLADAALRNWLAVLDNEEIGKNALQEMTGEWIVQRERGAVPGPLTEEDFQAIWSSLGLDKEPVPPQAAPQPEPQPEPQVEAKAAPQVEQAPIFPALDSIPVSESWQSEYMPAEASYENDVLADGRLVGDVLKEDPLYFARLHLALSL